jgi:hypothetical protein
MLVINSVFWSAPPNATLVTYDDALPRARVQVARAVEYAYGEPRTWIADPLVRRAHPVPFALINATSDGSMPALVCATAQNK